MQASLDIIGRMLFYRYVVSLKFDMYACLIQGLQLIKQFLYLTILYSFGGHYWEKVYKYLGMFGPRFVIGNSLRNRKFSE